MRGRHEIRLQQGGFGYFARVGVEVEWTVSPPELAIELAVNPESWEPGLRFGIAYAFEHTVQGVLPLQGLSVRVTEFGGYAVDTKQIVVAFAAMNAVWNALDYPPTRAPQLDAQTGLFTFPK
jgi:hypothetical protein